MTRLSVTGVALTVALLLFGGCTGDDDGGEASESDDAATEDGSEEPSGDADELLDQPIGPGPFTDYLELEYGDEAWHDVLQNVQTGGPDEDTVAELRLFMEDDVTDSDALAACEAGQSYASGVGEELEVVVDTIHDGAFQGAELVIAPPGGTCEPVAG